MKTIEICSTTNPENIGIQRVRYCAKPVNTRCFSLILFICMIWVVLTIHPTLAFSQQQHSIVLEPVPSVFLGFSSGINNYSGLAGVGMEAPLMSSVSLFGQAGLGTWGTKLGAGLRYYPDQIPFGSAWGIGYSVASGLENFETELEVDNPARTQLVLLDLDRVATLNIDYSYNLRLGRMNKISFHAGYSIRLGGNEHYTVKTSGVVLSSTSVQVMRMLQPGGLLLGLSLMIGI